MNRQEANKLTPGQVLLAYKNPGSSYSRDREYLIVAEPDHERPIVRTFQTEGNGWSRSGGQSVTGILVDAADPQEREHRYAPGVTIEPTWVGWKVFDPETGKEIALSDVWPLRRQVYVSSRHVAGSGPRFETVEKLREAQGAEDDAKRRREAHEAAWEAWHNQAAMLARPFALGDQHVRAEDGKVTITLTADAARRAIMDLEIDVVLTLTVPGEVIVRRPLPKFEDQP